MKILLVAEANLNRTGAPKQPLSPDDHNGYGGRLIEILGVNREEYLERFECANICQYKWAPIKAQKTATVLLLNAPTEQVIALFGSRVTRAFGLTYIPYTTKGRYRILPHLGKGPKWGWDMKENVERARKLLGF